MTQLEGFSEFAETVRADWAVPGMAVGVVKEGNVVFLQGFGNRDVEKQLPVTTNTLFAIGSSTKCFTAMAIGMLVDDGKLNLDTPLIEYLPDLRLFDEYATLHATPRDLLCHRTGMPGYDALWILTRVSRDQLLHRLRYLQPNVSFRDDFQYNNVMYMVAGVLIGRLGGGSWEDFVAERIFRLLAMRNSNFRVGDSQKTNDFSQPYITFTGEPVRVPPRMAEAVAPAGGINSNIEDMTKWILLHLNNGKSDDVQLISEASLMQMHRQNVAVRNPLYEKLTEASMYGQGWYITDHRGYRLVEHGGNIDGFSALVSLLPEKNIGVIFLSNSMNITGYVIVRDVYDRLLDQEERDWNSHYKGSFAEIMKLFSGGGGEQEEPKPNTAPSLPIADYAGEYRHPAFDSVHVAVNQGKISLEFQSGLTSELSHFHFDDFEGTTSDFYLPKVRVRFHLSDRGSMESFSMPVESGVPDIVFSRQQSR